MEVHEIVSLRPIPSFTHFSLTISRVSNIFIFHPLPSTKMLLSPHIIGSTARSEEKTSVFSLIITCFFLYPDEISFPFL
ncbi:unnamed protein product [Lupinus luteus]|uniref:Uncharacterized protein n=1 Tax=Lupinus luteus TaxID=3873 RepID=A0AAV1YI25_LUPLU